MRALLAMAMMLGVAAPTLAAPPRPGTSDELALVAVQNFGRCVAEQSPAGARGVLMLDYRSSDYRLAMRRLLRGHERCFPRGAEMRGGQLLYAGALAEAVLNDDARGKLSQALRFDPALPPVVARDESETMALCVVRRAPEAVANLIETTAASASESVAAGPVMQQLPGCLANGAKLRLNGPGLRSLVSLAAFRIALANGAVRGLPSNEAAR